MTPADLDANANLVHVVAFTDVGVEESLEWHSANFPFTLGLL